MSEADLWTLIIEYNVAVLSTFALYLTLVSGFLVVTYLVGAQLTHWQTLIISGGFTVSASFFVFAVYGYGTRAVFLTGKTSPEYQSAVMTSYPAVGVLILILVLGIFACLKFMWDVRHRE